MKKLFIFMMFVFLIFNLTSFKTFANTTSTTYYVDYNNGNDANTGTHVSQALKSVEKAYEKANKSGDTICIIEMYTFPGPISLPPKSVKITSLDSKGEINFRYDVSINADTVFENIDLAFMNSDEYGERAIYANGHNLTIGPGVDTNYQQDIKYASVYGGSFTKSIDASPNITLISGQFDTIYAGGYNNYTVTDATINLKSNGALQIASLEATSVSNPDNVVINYINSGSKVSNKVNAGDGTVNFTDTNTDLKYPIENASKISVSRSTLNIYERGSFKSSSKKRLNFSFDSNSRLEIGEYITLNIDGNFEGNGTINFLPNSYLNINGNVSGSTKITQHFPESRTLISGISGAKNNFYSGNGNYQIEFEQTSGSVKWRIFNPSEASKIYYVNGAAEKHGDGSSAENPFSTIEEAIAIAGSKDGDYIYISGDTNVAGNLDIDKSITISGTENAKLNFVHENPSINITSGDIVFESNLNITGSVPDMYMENCNVILNGGKFNRIYAQDTGAQLEVKGSLINTIENFFAVEIIGYGENNNFAVLPNLINISGLTISSSYIEFNSDSIDIQSLTVENSTINVLENISIKGTASFGGFEPLDVNLNIASGKKLEFENSIRITSDVYMSAIGDPDENTYLVCSSSNFIYGGSIKSAYPDNYGFEEIKDEYSTFYKLKRKPEYIVPVSSIKLDKSNISLKVGETEKITATVLPEYAADKSIYWISSDKNIATVDEHGNVEAVSKGTANITAITNDGNKTSTCVVNVTEKVIPVTNIELDKTNLNLEIGDSQKIIATVLPENATVKDLSWESTNPEIATVDNTGNVTAISEGTATITASSGSVSSKCIVHVSKKNIPITGIELDKTNLNLLIGDSQKIIATVLPENATVKDLSWKSTNPEIATVDNTGNVTAVSEGITTITASSGSVSSNCIVHVSKKNIPVTSIELDKTNLNLLIGDSQKIIATVLPENASVKDLSWKSTNPEIATVDNTGNVIAVSEGITTITASSGSVSSNCIVHVSKKNIPVTSIELDKTNLNLLIGDSQKIIATVLPENATIKDLSWKSTNPEIATVDNAGNVIAVSEGITTITASSGSVSSNCIVHVSKKNIPVTSIELDKTNLNLLIGDSQKIIATVLPENATVKDLSWKSSNPEVATIDNAGNVTAVSEGITTITASSGSVSSNCIVHVSKKNIPVTSIELDKTNLNLLIGDSQKIIATVLPENATIQDLNWESTNPEIATVDDTGNVTAVSKGTAKITVSSYDKTVKSYCNINVYTLSNAEIELSKAIEEANEILIDSNVTVESLLKEIIKLSGAIKNLKSEK